jgi:superfamily II DNA or RNA helicase
MTFAVKTSGLNPGVVLQPHQQRIEDMSVDNPIRKLLVHSLGSGKSLSGIAAAEALGEPYTAIAPASLRVNYENELDKFTDRKTPSSVMSYSALASGKQPDNHGTLIFDEAHNLRNPASSRAQNAIAAADRAKQVVMLSGTPIVVNFG